jgi:hypothetical protein
MNEFNFKDQLSVGGKGEAMFLKMFPKLEKADGIKYDFQCNGKTIELKTDTYSIEDTQNFFMERYSSIESKKLGGPWRAHQDNVDFFVYLYEKGQHCYWFDTKRLIPQLDDYIKQHKPRQVEINNTSWTTLGYLIPRKALVNQYFKLYYEPIV